MNKQEFLNRVEEVLEITSGSLTGEEQLTSFESWDSMAAISFVCMMDEMFGVQVTPAALEQCKTVTDLAGLVGNQVQG
jgi:acyl carrier protein